MPTVFNAANELAVKKFLHGQDPIIWIFTDIIAAVHGQTSEADFQLPNWMKYLAVEDENI